MTALQSLTEKMERTKLYRLEDTTRVYGEISAYATVLQSVYDILEEIERECFVESAEGRGLDFWCQVCGIKREEHTDSENREMILLRQAVGNESYTYEDIMNYIRSYGYDGSFVFGNGGKTVLFRCSTPNLTAIQKKKAFEKIKTVFPPMVTLTVEWTNP
ncbi:MAG: hypothetical protein ACI4M3_00780 [Acutalibacteraceae bacterium]